MKLSDNIKIIRKENNLSQEQLAEQLGVSRQAVSKWESGQSLPEMDKVLLICKLYNYNIDELMNENVKEVSDTKESKININKYIDDFFNYITKTVNMFEVMKFKQKIKCLIEQIMIVFLLFGVFAILGGIGYSILSNLFQALPDNVYYLIRNIIEAIYTIISLIIGITIVLHIFKIRYLDYYEIVKNDDEKLNDNNSNYEENDDNKKTKIFIEPKKEKVIIRDPEHSQSKFLTGIIKFVLICIKAFVAFFAIWFVISFVGLVTLLILSFLFVKTGAAFIGVFLGIISAILINFILLQISYNFIVEKKNHKTRLWVILITSLVLLGIGIGIFLIGTTQFNIVEKNDIHTEVEDVYNIKMTDNLSINNWIDHIEYIETDSDELKIVVKHSKYFKMNFENINDILYFSVQEDNSTIMASIRDYIEFINKKEIVNLYDYPTIYIHTSKQNIEKLQENTKVLQENQMKEMNNLYSENEKLQNTIIELENNIVELKQEIEENKFIIDNQNIEIQEKENTIMILENENQE